LNLNSETDFGKMEDSPCRECIVKMICKEPFGCYDLSKHISNKITYIPIVSLELVKKEPRRKLWLTKLKAHAKNVLSK